MAQLGIFQELKLQLPTIVRKDENILKCTKLFFLSVGIPWLLQKWNNDRRIWLSNCSVVLCCENGEISLLSEQICPVYTAIGEAKRKSSCSIIHTSSYLLSSLHVTTRLCLFIYQHFLRVSKVLVHSLSA